MKDSKNKTGTVQSNWKKGYFAKDVMYKINFKHFGSLCTFSFNIIYCLITTTLILIIIFNACVTKIPVW